MSRFTFILAFLCAAGSASAQTPSWPQLSEMMKPHLADAVPAILVEQSRNWGKTSMVPHAIHWRGLRPEVRKTPRNDGHWTKIKITPRYLPSTLGFSISEPRRVDGDRQNFGVFVTFLTNIEFEQQLWESGVRLFSGSTRARCRLMLWMDVENTVRLDSSKDFVPDLVVRLRVTKAKLECNDFVVEHTAGVGGSTARVLGEGLEGLVKEVQPDLERRLLDRAGIALVRAADTKEIRLGLGSLWKNMK